MELKADETVYGFFNTSGLEFKDISSEVNRTYTFANGGKLLIKKPLKLNVSKSGGHRIFDAEGYSYYIKPGEGWYIVWEVEKDKPNFVT